jgi:uroporphyrinogen-III decarboxylase
MSHSTQDKKTSTFDPSPQYLARRKRLDDAMNLRKPDRVPVAPLIVHYYPTRARGVSNRDAMYHMDRTLDMWKEATMEHNWDGAPPPGPMIPVRPMEILGMTQFKWPGGGLGDDHPFQWVEGEYMMQDEYDEVLADPNGFAVKKLWPRISSTMAPLSRIAQRPSPPLLFLSNAYALPGFLGGMISQPSMRALLQRALELVEAQEKLKVVRRQYRVEVENLGFPILWGPSTFPPFDWISDTLRGLRGALLDMYQAPDKLLALIEMFTPLTIGGCVSHAKKTGNKSVFIPMHRGAGGFMSNEQFGKFYWPSYKALLLGLVEAGLTPIPLFEGDYTPRLEFLKELPPGKIVGHFDKIDRKKAKALIGDVMCFWGNVPASLMCTGTPEQVSDDVKELIDLFGDNGGLVIDSTMGLPDESKPENVQALTDAVHELGVY